MRIDPKEVGERLRKARKDAGYADYTALAKDIYQNSEKKGRNKVSPETVRRWEAGLTIPPWDKIDQICTLLRIEPEELLFIRHRTAQIRADRPRLVYVTLAEADLVITFRHASPAAQKRIASMAANLAADDPAPTAEFHVLKSAPT